MFAAQVSKGNLWWLAIVAGDERYESQVEEEGGGHLGRELASCHPHRRPHSIGVWGHRLGHQPCAS